MKQKMHAKAQITKQNIKGCLIASIKNCKNSYNSKRIDSRILANAWHINRKTENYSPEVEEVSLLSTRSSNFSRDLRESEAWKFKATRVDLRNFRRRFSIVGGQPVIAISMCFEELYHQS